MCVLFWFGYTRGMRRILATLAVVGALLFSAGSAWADDKPEANKLFVDAVADSPHGR